MLKRNIVREEMEGFHLTTFPGESFVKPRSRWLLVSTVSDVFCAGLILILRCCLEREVRIILASHRVMILVRVSHILTNSDDSTAWWSLKLRERRGTRGQPPLQREI